MQLSSRQIVLGVLIAAGVGWANPSTALAQFDFLQSLFGPRRPAPQVFNGDANLNAAYQAAQRGDCAESLKLTRAAFAERGAQSPRQDPGATQIAAKLVALSEVWEEQQADAAEVAAVLQEVVLPRGKPNEFWPYPVPWQPSHRPWSPHESRYPQPQSVSAELVKWSARAQALDQLTERLSTAHESLRPQLDVLTVQLFVAKRDAQPAIQALQRLKSAPLTDPSQQEWALQAVTAGSLFPETRNAAWELLEVLLNSVNPNQPSQMNECRFVLQLGVARGFFEANRPDDAARLAQAAAQLPLSAQRYGSEMAEYVAQVQHSQAAETLLRGHRTTEALELLAKVIDGPSSRYEMYYPASNVAALLGRELAALPAERRFELLAEWTLPRQTPERLRALQEFVPARTVIPMSDRPSDADPLPATGLFRNIYSTAWHWFVTAKELQRLDAVIADLSRLPQDQPDTQALQVLALLVRDADSPDATRRLQLQQRLQALVDLTAANIPKWEDNPKRPLSMLTCVVALEAAQSPALTNLSQDLLMRLIEHTQRLQWDRPRPHLRMAWAEMLRRSSGIAGRSPTRATSAATIPSAWHDLRPKHWIASGADSAARQANGTLPDVWLAHEESIEHLIGRYDSTLLYEYPLTGDFEFTAEVSEGAWSEGAIGFGGTYFATNGYADGAPLFAPGRTHSQWSPSLVNLLHRNPWNRQKLEVRDGVVRYYANGQLVYEDEPGVSAPWLCLSSDWGRTPIYRNLRFTGTPSILREVPLLTDLRLRGWMTQLFDETRHDPLQAQAKNSRLYRSRQSLAFPVTVSTDEGQPSVAREIALQTDWYFEKEELHSPRRDDVFNRPIPSCIQYYRPLQPGETVSYEFFAKSEEFVAHPSIGNMILELTPRHVILRPLSVGALDVRDEGGVVREHAHSSEWHDQGWNTVMLRMTADQIELVINNGEPLTLPLANPHDRVFGFWHDAARSAARVRNVVLRGPWPEAWAAAHQTAIERPVPVNPPASRTFVNQVMGEKEIASNAYGVYQRALQLDDDARYQYLYRWVMPGADHETLRTVGAFTPTHPSPPALLENPIDVATAEARQSLDGRRVQTGGSFVCPAVLLIFTALELGRLGDLSDALDQLPASARPGQIRARTAMHGMIALLEDRVDHARSALWECNQLLESGSLEQEERWSEPAFCSLAILHPETREVAWELLDRLQRRQIQSGQPGTSEFNRYVRFLHGQALYLQQGGTAEAFGTNPALKQWLSVSQPCARSRGAGVPPAAFDHVNHEWNLRGGHDLEMLYFQSPLRGDFELRARLSQFDYRELIPLVGGVASVVRFDGKNKKLQGIRSTLQEIPLEQEHTRRARAYGDYRVVVKNGHLTVFVNDQKLHEQPLPPERDPWIALQGWSGQSSRVARNVVLSGTPEIPRELDLLAPPDLQGWLADYYGGSTGQVLYPWKREQDELICPQAVIRGATPGRLKVENILRYHRPMLEDGDITYEFYYDPEAKIAEPRDNQRSGLLDGSPSVNWLPSQVSVHPALDRMVLLLEAEGVKLHWLTDGKYDRTNVSPGNATPLESTKPLPLKKQEWNAVHVQVRGDELTLVLNGETVLQHPIEPTNQRHFGFFHHVNESTARVRNVRYRGEWPQQLPSVADQELAQGPEIELHGLEQSLRSKVDYDMARTPLDPNEFSYLWDAKVARFIKSTPQGLRMTFPAGEQKGATVAGFAPRMKVKGDFIATLDYEQLSTVPVKEAWGSGLSFKIKLNASYDAGIEVRRTSTGTVLNCVWQMPTPSRNPVYYSESFSEFPTEGRLRLARRGSTIYFLVAEPGSDDFRLLTTRSLGAADLERVGTQVDCSDVAGGADVVVKRLVIQAKEIVRSK